MKITSTNATGKRLRMAVTHKAHRYDAGRDTYATIEHEGGSITLLIPPGMSVADGLRQRAEERGNAANEALRKSEIILSAIDLLDTDSPRRART